MAARMELTAGILAGALGALLIVFSILSDGTHLGLGSVVPFAIMAVLIGLVSAGAYLHSRYGYGLRMLWLGLILLEAFTAGSTENGSTGEGKSTGRANGYSSCASSLYGA